MYIGKLYENVIEKYLIKLFVLKKTQYFQDNCWINLVISKSTVQHRGFGFFTTPDQSHNQLLKLYAVEFQVIPISVETARSRYVHQNHASATQDEAKYKIFPWIKKQYSPFLGQYF